MQQIAQTEIGKKVLNKMDEKELAELDTEAIMIKQVEELENEKRQLVARLKAQEKKVDHLERAKRKEEIPLIKAAMVKVCYLAKVVVFKKNLVKSLFLVEFFLESSDWLLNGVN